MSSFYDLSSAMADAVAHIAPSLVRVEARRRMPATGIVWSAEGVIVTAHHVVEMEDNITIGLADGSEAKAKLVGRDPQNDLAVLKAEGAFTPATWGDAASLRVGQLVLALGRPLRDVQATLGTVSALVPGLNKTKETGKGKRRWREAMQVLMDGFIRTDVEMLPGFSGGALINGDGTVHGLITSGFGGEMSIAIPASTIRNSVEVLLKHGKMKQGYLGVGVQPVKLQAALAQQAEQAGGLLLTSVEANSPAEQAGLLVGDVLLALDGIALEQADTLLALLYGERVGKAVALKLVRGGVLHDLSVTIGERN